MLQGSTRSQNALFLSWLCSTIASPRYHSLVYLLSFLTHALHFGSPLTAGVASAVFTGTVKIPASKALHTWVHYKSILPANLLRFFSTATPPYPCFELWFNIILTQFDFVAYINFNLISYSYYLLPVPPIIQVVVLALICSYTLNQ